MGKIRLEQIPTGALYAERGKPKERVTVNGTRYRLFPGSTKLWYREKTRYKDKGLKRWRSCDIVHVLEISSQKLCAVDLGATTWLNILYIRGMTKKEAVRKIGLWQGHKKAGMSSSGLRYKLQRALEILGD